MAIRNQSVRIFPSLRVKSKGSDLGVERRMASILIEWFSALSYPWPITGGQIPAMGPCCYGARLARKGFFAANYAGGIQSGPFSSWIEWWVRSMTVAASDLRFPEAWFVAAVAAAADYVSCAWRKRQEEEEGSLTGFCGKGVQSRVGFWLYNPLLIKNFQKKRVLGEDAQDCNSCAKAGYDSR